MGSGEPGQDGHLFGEAHQSGFVTEVATQALILMCVLSVVGFGDGMIEMNGSVFRNLRPVGPCVCICRGVW